MSIKNYRKLYKDYYNIDFDNNFVVHHIDFNRNNNQISNLLLLPKELHIKYHSLLNSFNIFNWDIGKLILDVKIRAWGNEFEYDSFDKFLEFHKVFMECQQWAVKKQLMDIKKQYGVIC